PVFSDTRLLRIRALVPSWNWWNDRSWWWTEYSFTGTLTSPKLMDPDQMARGMGDLHRRPIGCWNLYPDPRRGEHRRPRARRNGAATTPFDLLAIFDAQTRAG